MSASSPLTDPVTDPVIDPDVRQPLRSARIDARALDKARLSVVSRRRTAAPRLPFVVLVSAILLGGMVGLLCFNTQMQGAAFSATRLSNQASVQAARQQSLETAVQKLQAPQRIAAWAQRHGMVIPPTSQTFRLGQHELTGLPAVPATRAVTPPIAAPPARKPHL